MQSLRARVDEDVRDLIKGNAALRQVRYSWPTRCLRSWISGRSVFGWLAWYASSVAFLLAFEWIAGRFFPAWLAFFKVPNPDFTRDVAGVLITAQVGLLAVLTVAVTVVTLLSEKDDDVTANTNVRLYYVESCTNEFTTSSIAFLIVVVAQLFWPLQELIHHLPGFKSESLFKHILTEIHAAWLILNCALFLQFLRMTLDFVVADNRVRLRKRYVASEIIPRDVARRLLAAYYLGAPTFMLGKQSLDAGPLVRFGTGLISSERGTVEIARKFRAPSRLDDVWLLPLSFALKRWFDRSRKLQGETDRRFGSDHWNGELAVPYDFKVEADGNVELLLRDGGAPLTKLELALINLSLRFARVDRRELRLPTPKDFIEQLITRVIRTIEADAANAFDDVLRETTDFHSFLLEAQNTRDEQGTTINLAQIQDGWFLVPEQAWVGAYRRAFTAAAKKLATDPYFASGMARVPIALWPKASGAYPASVLQTILELGRYEVVTLEEWLDRRTRNLEAGSGSAASLTSSDRAAYEGVVVSFVSAWETLEQIIISSFDLHSSIRGGDASYWQAARASWPSLERHLRNAAFFLASAVWNDDGSGSERYRDLVLRWLQPFYRELQNAFPFRDSVVLTPAVMRETLPEARTTATRVLLYTELNLPISSIYGAVLREAHNDVVCITGALMLYWYTTKRQPSPVAQEAALRMFNRESLPGGGADLIERGGQGPKSIFRLVFDVLFRQALASRFEDSSYSAYLEGLIRALNDLSAPRMVPGRIYTGVGLDGFETLTPEFLAVMAAQLPPAETGDDSIRRRRRGNPEQDFGIAEFMQRVLATEPALQDDGRLTGFSYVFQGYARQLSGDGDERFQAAAELWGAVPDLDDQRARLRGIFEGIVQAIRDKRMRRMREAPLDETKIRQVQDQVTSALVRNTQPAGVFAPIAVERTDRTDIEQIENSFGVLERGLFTRPQMSLVTFEEIPGFIVSAAITSVQNQIWMQLGQRTRIEANVSNRENVRAFYEQALHAAGNPELGEDLVLMVPNEPFASPLYMTAAGFPAPELDGFDISRDETVERVAGNLYAGSLQGIHVFGWPFDDVAVLCSRTLLQSISYGLVRGTDGIFDFELYDNGDPNQGSVRYWVAPELTWEDRPVVWFKFHRPRLRSNGQRPIRRAPRKKKASE